MNLRLNTKVSERPGCFFHRQADNVCVRAVDFCDDLRTAALRGVGAGLVQRIHFLNIIVNRCAAQVLRRRKRTRENS